MERLSEFLTTYPWLYAQAVLGLRVLVIIAIVMGCAKFIHAACERILAAARRFKPAEHARAVEREKRMATVVKLVDTSLRVILYGAALLMALRELGLDITPLLTGAGIAGVALGLGAQSMVKDIIAGLFLLLEDQIRVGDVVRLNNQLSGTVERLELRVTALRDADGTLHIVPNGEIKSVSNMTYDFSQAVVDVPVPYGVDLRALEGALRVVATDLEDDAAWKSRLRGRPEFQGLQALESAHIVARLVARTEPHAQWAVARELRRRAVESLTNAGVGVGPAGLKR